MKKNWLRKTDNLVPESEIFKIKNVKGFGNLEIYYFDEIYSLIDIKNFFNFFINKIKGTGTFNKEIKKILDNFLLLFSCMHLVRKEQYNEILSELEVDTDILILFEQEVIALSKLVLKQTTKLELKKKFLAKHLLVDNAVEKFYEILVFYEKEDYDLHSLLTELEKKGNEEHFYLEFLSFFTFLHLANIHQYRNLVEILEETKNVDKDRIEKFENEIIIPFSFSFLEMTNIERFEILTPLFDLAMKKDIFRSDAQIAVTKKELEVESTELDRKEFEVFINKNGKFN